MPRERRRRRRQQYNTKTTTTVEIHKTSSIALDHRAYSRKKIPQVRRREKEHQASLLPFLFCFSLRSLSLSLFIIVAFEILLRLSRVFFCPPFAKFSRRAFPWCRDGVRATKCAHKRVQKQSRSFYSVMRDFDAFARVRLVVFHFTERERDILERKGVGKGVGVTLPKFYRIATNRFASNTHLRSSRA